LSTYSLTLSTFVPSLTTCFGWLGFTTIQTKVRLLLIVSCFDGIPNQVLSYHLLTSRFIN